VSTYVYLECLDHTPPLRADDESGQHLSDLPQIRADLADRARIVADYNASAYWLLGDDIATYFRRHTARFLAAHPRCRVGIRDEYGRAYPTEAPEDERTKP